uniref:Junctional adhesion molecule A n=1 Tax=Phasianus colchicus TaxID=9054 RepID=A0A669QMF8_PHACC
APLWPNRSLLQPHRSPPCPRQAPPHPQQLGFGVLLPPLSSISPRSRRHPVLCVPLRLGKSPHRVEVPEGLFPGALLLCGGTHRYYTGLGAVGGAVLSVCPSPNPPPLPADPYKNRVVFSVTSIHFSTVTREDTGKYICEVVGDNSQIAKSEVNLIVQVPPSKPVAHVPSSATIGRTTVLRCTESDGSPPPTFRWYRDGMLIPTDPKSSLSFRNSSYTLDSTTGELTFNPVSAFDTGDYYCEASNNVGTAQRSDAVRMEASEVNVGGIVAAVVVLLMLLGLIAFGIWFAYSRGYFQRKE